MASVFSHILVAGTAGKLFPIEKKPAKLYVLGMICSAIPDADILMFRLGFSYGHPLGHRGFFHSLLFAAVLGVLSTWIYSKKWKQTKVTLYFFVCAASHGVLDALTNGGKGVAFFSPFDLTRYFLPWRPIQVSPIGASHFFSEWGWRVIQSELIWIGLPCLVLLWLSRRSSRGTS